jgi:hypothetical protein
MKFVLSIMNWAAMVLVSMVLVEKEEKLSSRMDAVESGRLAKEFF